MKVFIAILAIVGVGLGAGIAHSWVNARRPMPVTLHLAPNKPASTTLTPTVPTMPTASTGASGPTASPTGATAAPPAARVDPPASAEAGQFIDVKRAKELFDRGQAQGDVVFIDARKQDEFLAGHVAGAMHLPPSMFGGIIPKKVKDYLPGRTVVIYCVGAECDDSINVGKRIQLSLKDDAGPIYVMKEGFEPWKKAGNPVETGPEVGW